MRTVFIFSLLSQFERHLQFQQGTIIVQKIARILVKK